MTGDTLPLGCMFSRHDLLFIYLFIFITYKCIALALHHDVQIFAMEGISIFGKIIDIFEKKDNY